MNITLEVVRGRGLPERIVIEASSVSAAKSQATSMGYKVLSVRTRTVNWHGPNTPSKTQAQLSRTELVLFIEQLSALLLAGLSVLEVLETLHKSGNSRSRVLTSQLIARLREGHRLSDAIEQAGHFPPLLISLIRSAELTSDLPLSLSRFLEHEGKTEKIKRHLISVALYPALLILVGGAVMFFLLTYVMPRFARIFESMQNLPLSATLMVQWSHFLKNHGSDLLLAIAATGLTLAATISVGAARTKLLRSLVNTPGLAQHIRVYFLSRWYRTIGMLVEGGIPLPEALRLACQVLPLGMRQGGQTAEDLMREGQSPAYSFSHSLMATPVATQLLQAGEKSGDVGKMLIKAAEFHENDVAKILERSMRIFEPIVMTFIGVGIGVTVVFMYLPIFELASAIQ